MTDITPNRNLSDKIVAILEALDRIDKELSVFDDVDLLNISVGKSAFLIARSIPFIKLDLEAIRESLVQGNELTLQQTQLLSSIQGLLNVTNARLTEIRDCTCRTAAATEALLELEAEDADECLFSEYISDDTAYGVVVNPTINLALTPTYTAGSFPPSVDLSSGLITGQLNVVTIPSNELNDWKVKYVTDADNVLLYDGVLPIPSDVITPDTWYPASVASGKAAFIDRVTIGKRKKRKSRRYAEFASRAIVAVWCYRPTAYVVTDVLQGECKTIEAVAVTEVNANGTYTSYVAPFTVKGQGLTSSAGSNNSFINMTPGYIALDSGVSTVRVTLNEEQGDTYFVTEQNNELSGVKLSIDAPFDRTGAPKYFVIGNQPFNITVCVIS